MRKNTAHPPQDDDGEPYSLSVQSEMIDLLVDGELSEPERRLLLNHFDKNPAGWKDCAIAFLQAAMFRKAFKANSEESGISDGNHKKSVFGSAYDTAGASFRRPLSRKLAFPLSLDRHTVFAMLGGSFLALFLCGVVFFMIESSRRGNIPHVPGDTIIVSTDDHGAKSDKSSDFEPFSPGSSWEAVDPNVPLHYVTLHSGNPDFRGLQFPCYSAKSLNPETYLSTYSTVQKDEVQQLRNAGHRVNVQRQNIVVHDNDGKRVVIPVDQVTIQYRSRAKYQ